jgi:hypothetical protein
MQMSEDLWLQALDAALEKPGTRFNGRRRDDGLPTPPELGGDRPGEVEARLARIERLLDVDLDKLGSAALSEAVDGLEARMSALAVRLDAMVSVVELIRRTAQAARAQDGLSTRLDDLTDRIDDISQRLLD